MPVVHARRLGGHGVVLVVEGEVVEDVLAGRAVHLLQAVLHDGRRLVGEGRVVGAAHRDRRGEQLALPVLVLQALAQQRGAPGGGPQQEAACPGVTGQPDQVAHPLEAEHRVEGEEGGHGHPPGGMGGGGGDPRGHRPGLGDPLLQDLPVAGLLVGEQQVVVHRLVELAARGVDAQLLEQGVHAEGAALVGDDGHHPRPESLVPRQVAQQAGEGHGGRDLLRPRAGVELGEGLVAGEGEGAAQLHRAAGQRAAQGAPPGQQVLHLRGIQRRAVEGGLPAVGQRLVGDLGVQLQAVAQRPQLVVGQLLDLVGGVAALRRRGPGSSPSPSWPGSPPGRRVSSTAAR